MKFIISILTGFVFICALEVSGATPTAKLNTEAPVGGTFSRNLTGEPASLHPVAYSDLYAQSVLSYVVDTLAERNPTTNDFEPRLAEKWETSKDQRIYTFYLRKDALFSDGKPVTAEDVKFSYDAIFEPAYKATDKQPYFEGIAKVEVVDPHTIRFHLKDTYFQNFIAMATMLIIPKHVYGDVEKSRRLTRTVVASGPYTIDRFDRGSRIVLKRNDQWYGFKLPQFKGAFNFATINLRFIKDQSVSFEMMQKGELDFEEMTAETFATKTEGGPWGKAVFKNKVENKMPKRSMFIGWNFRREMFQNRSVRLALAHLLNREEINQKFRYGMSEPIAGPVYNESEYAAKDVKPIAYDRKAAGNLLLRAGGKDSNKDGVLDKIISGKRTDFRFTLIYSNKDFEKYWALYKEDLKKAGIEMELKYLEWGAFLKVLDEGNFDAVTLAWAGTFDWDPKQIWHSSSAVPGGSNFIAYKNQNVDKLIDQARMEPNKAKRIAKMHQIYRQIAADAPYAWLFNDKYFLYAHSNRVEKPADTFNYEVGFDYWWSKAP